jgi:hypothetical protein
VRSHYYWKLGQHYNIDTTHPLKWSTVMKPSRLWDFLSLYSNYHAERPLRVVRRATR